MLQIRRRVAVNPSPSAPARIGRAGLARRAGCLAAALLLAAAARSAGAATNLQPVSMRLDWLYQGPNAGFMVAKDRGIYSEAGLDVTVSPGKGSGSTAQLIATKADLIGFADGFVLGNSVAKGMNIRMVASIYRRNPTAVVILDESNIKTPKDLEGKTVAIPTGAAQYQQWPAFVKGCGLDGGKIKVVNIDPAGSPTALALGKVDAIAGFAQGYVPGVEIRGGKKARVLWYADCGVSAVSNGIVVHNDLLKENPALIRSFVAASLKGFLWARKNPDEAAAIVRKFSETVNPAIARREMEMSWNTWVTPNTRGKPLGWMSDRDWDDTVKNLREYGGVTTPLDPKALYTNEFVPTGEEFLPPQP
ncbi:MAG TPA: ABC transporter substrate-binding protein [Candidatus Methylomirabilis sp.]|jgi:NitT/TauT family transport system substrate-binding protein